jgi:glycogen debranching enzyme
MSDHGFDIDIFTMWNDDIGFVSGGSKLNCGTWMDKMGDSEKAKTKGVPATPRDGADIEIIGLLKSTLNWIVKDLIDKVPHWKWKRVSKGIIFPLKLGNSSYVTYTEWNNMIQNSFEKCFYIPAGKF